jgi:hypothetical protein
MAVVTETRHLTAQIPLELFQAIEKKAKSNERSVSAEVRLALRSHIERKEAA